ncbi:MAG: 4Fe-4S binding protein [Erysipelotrichaceae bacterium]|nr:4Fe-4S binding protein [Erysipelotrichaceae bacterium]
MDAQYYLKYISEKIHTVIVGTVDEEGMPITSAIDMMDADESGLYFLTAKGKNFYDRLKKRGSIALTALQGEDTLSSISISVRGKVKEIGNDRIPYLFEKNPYMKQIYPNEGSRMALTVFQIYEGTGEYFDLSKRPIDRASFSFGKEEVKEAGYLITDKCIGCGNCLSVCPQSCIDHDPVPFVIRQNNCLRCGGCMSVCPADAVIRR